MARNLSAFVFILLATILVLAVAIIPHHHHSSEVCIVSSHCEADEDSHSECGEAHKHQHEAEANTQSCFLEQLYVVPSNKSEQRRVIQYQREHESTFSFDQTANTSLNFSANTLSKNRLKAGFLSPPFLYSDVLSQSKGLRAPPLV